MISDKSKRVTITINKDLDDAINDFMIKAAPSLQIQSKSHLFSLAIVDFFMNLEETLKKNTKKGDK